DSDADRQGRDDGGREARRAGEAAHRPVQVEQQRCHHMNSSRSDSSLTSTAEQSTCHVLGCETTACCCSGSGAGSRVGRRPSVPLTQLVVSLSRNRLVSSAFGTYS